MRRFMYKVEAGADFAVTQPVFDAGHRWSASWSSTAAWPLPVVAGIWPLTSLRNAEFLANEVPGRRRARRGGGAHAPGPGAGRRGRPGGGHRHRPGDDGGGALPMVQGVHVSTPEGDVDAALAVLDGVLTGA